MVEQFKGAEATVELKQDLVVKKREPKKYRHPKLDERLRADRTEAEQHLIDEARRYNVNTPEVNKIDDSTLEIDRIDGKPLKEIVESNPGYMEEYGRNIAYLHSADIIHGDLTTSNAIFGDKLWIIDFGLAFRSQRIEDRAVDIHLLKQVLNSSHPEVAEEAWEKFLDGYREYEKSEKVLEQLKDVEKRGRYK